jgi:hypothetical protein
LVTSGIFYYHFVLLGFGACVKTVQTLPLTDVTSKRRAGSGNERGGD